MKPPSYFLEYGHFIGKTGEHINAKLRKERLFDSPELLAIAVSSLEKIVLERPPSLLVSEETHGVLLARGVGENTGIPVLAYNKDGSISDNSNYANKEPEGEVAIIEDNIITGDSVSRLLDRIKERGMTAGQVVSLFSSVTNSDLDFEYRALIHLPISSKLPEDCSGHGE